MIIVIFAPISGAHFNPAVTLVVLLNRGMRAQHALAYTSQHRSLVGFAQVCLWPIQCLEETIFALGIKHRTGAGQWLSVGKMANGLTALVIFVSKQSPVETVAAAVALYITAAYWFTASTSLPIPR